METNADEFICSVFLGDGEDAGKVGLALKGCPLAEIDGVIVPAIAMTPAQARAVAEDLNHFAFMAERVDRVVN